MRFLLKSCLITGILILIVYGFKLRPLQKVKVDGKLICNGKAAKGIRIKMFELDDILFDDLMGKTKTGRNGRFYITGSAREISRIAPKLNIYHRCNQSRALCDVKIPIKIPTNKASYGSQEEPEIFHLGIIELGKRWPGQEDSDCIN
ncbi:unnamed protein product [Bursaphelenchus xylophilus]|uniref:(pine wood nematode) hypothetical protein n=1 Tax=Bursaphelenchus xylophilus TaxID=6326 RepID=A0A1I7RSJ4_BURXY|nr:unnamed protein product [Bursaphelenchus xylophilus]CAG9122899.1 unnamed protein product [Bursaphelenchus xylophilus]